MAIGALAAALLTPTAGGPALAQTDSKQAQTAEEAKPQLEQVQRDIEAAKAHRAELEKQAKALAAEVQKLREKAVSLAADIRKGESRLNVLDDKISLLKEQERDLNSSVDERMARMSDSLAALQRLAHRPPVAMIASPTPPAQTVKSALALRGVVPAIEDQVSDLKGEIAALADLRADIRKEQADRTQQVAALAKDKDRIDALMEERGKAERQVNAAAKREAQRVQKLASKAADLKELLATLEREKQKREAQLPPPFRAEHPFSQARGHLPYPVVGTLVQHFGDRDVGGLKARGIVFKTRAHAQVVAPYDGTIVFAGPFRGYGLLVIIDHGEGYHSLLSGMMRIDGVVGQSVLTGEPIGEMGTPGASGSGNSGNELYVELRYQGSPINPMPWLAASDRKVNG